MRQIAIGFCTILSLIFICSWVIAVGAAGNAEKGRAFFNDPAFGGGTAGISCNGCHPDGKGLEKAAGGKDLETTVNACIQNALKGKGIDPESSEMADMIAYLRSLKKKTPVAETPLK